MCRASWVQLVLVFFQTHAQVPFFTWRTEQIYLLVVRGWAVLISTSLT